MKSTIVLTIAAFLISPLNSAYAGSCDNCFVESIATGPSIDRDCASGSCVLVRIKTAGGRFVPDPCSKSTGWHFALDTSTASGKTSLTQLLDAHTNEKRVVIGGDNNCRIHNSGNVEDIGHIYLYWENDTVKGADHAYYHW